MTNMQLVFQAMKEGHNRRPQIAGAIGLTEAQVQSALQNLVTKGFIECAENRASNRWQGPSRYAIKQKVHARSRRSLMEPPVRYAGPILTEWRPNPFGATP